MALMITENAFSTRKEVEKEIEGANLWMLELQLEGGSGKPHWHEFYGQVYIIEGELTIRDESNGTTHTCGAGTRIVVPPRSLHSELAGGAKVLVGLAIDPATLGEAVDLPPTALAEAR